MKRRVSVRDVGSDGGAVDPAGWVAADTVEFESDGIELELELELLAAVGVRVSSGEGG